jgi:hypothetical protein
MGKNSRLHRCPCQRTDGPATVSPLRRLIPDRVAPERLYLEARRSSLDAIQRIIGGGFRRAETCIDDGRAGIDCRFDGVAQIGDAVGCRL